MRAGPGCTPEDAELEVFHAAICREHLLVALSRTAGEIEEGAARRYLEKAKYDVAEASIPERVGYRAAMNRGAALMETSDRHLNARAQTVLDELVKWVRMAAAARANRQRKEQAG